MLRYLNMFVLIGIVLVAVSLAGFATGGKFLHEPGQEVNSMASLIYLGAGALMLFNGILSIRTAPPQAFQPPKPTGNEAEAEDGETIVSA